MLGDDPESGEGLRGVLAADAHQEVSVGGFAGRELVRGRDRLRVSAVSGSLDGARGRAVREGIRHGNDGQEHGHFEQGGGAGMHDADVSASGRDAGCGKGTRLLRRNILRNFFAFAGFSKRISFCCGK